MEDKMSDQAVAIDNVANLYSQPEASADLVTQAIVGAPLAIQERQAPWYYVKMADGYLGWIHGRQIRVYNPGEPAYAVTGEIAEVRSLLAFLYAMASVSAQSPTLQVPIGARLAIFVDHGDWLEVALPSGTVRWVQRGDVEVLPAGAPRPRGDVGQVLVTAQRFLGLPYLWGGNTPLGIDCSGFVQLVYGLHGVSLLRDADIQYTQPGLAPVGRAELQPGDLVFFGGDKITHVGLYMGEGHFIHATTHGQPVVQISSLDEAHWTSRYQGARRP
jgi:cell wall-associated NlpC family hydrolase